MLHLPWFLVFYYDSLRCRDSNSIYIWLALGHGHAQLSLKYFNAKTRVQGRQDRSLTRGHWLTGLSINVGSKSLPKGPIDDSGLHGPRNHCRSLPQLSIDGRTLDAHQETLPFPIRLKRIRCSASVVAGYIRRHPTDVPIHGLTTIQVCNRQSQRWTWGLVMSQKSEGGREAIMASLLAKLFPSPFSACSSVQVTRPKTRILSSSYHHPRYSRRLKASSGGTEMAVPSTVSRVDISDIWARKVTETSC